MCVSVCVHVYLCICAIMKTLTRVHVCACVCFSLVFWCIHASLSPSTILITTRIHNYSYKRGENHYNSISWHARVPLITAFKDVMCWWCENKTKTSRTRTCKTRRWINDNVTTFPWKSPWDYFPRCDLQDQGKNFLLFDAKCFFIFNPD